jgi:hypothetical protein
VERNQVSEDAQGVTLQVPALTALQLYCDEVLTSDPQKSVELTIAGRSLGAHYLQWLRALRGNELGGPVLLRFRPNPATPEPKYDPYAWAEGTRAFAVAPAR